MDWQNISRPFEYKPVLDLPLLTETSVLPLFIGITIIYTGTPSLYIVVARQIRHCLADAVETFASKYPNTNPSDVLNVFYWYPNK